jgi:hypothetical protein
MLDLGPARRRQFHKHRTELAALNERYVIEVERTRSYGIAGLFAPCRCRS